MLYKLKLEYDEDLSTYTIIQYDWSQSVLYFYENSQFIDSKILHNKIFLMCATVEIDWHLGNSIGKFSENFGKLTQK